MDTIKSLVDFLEKLEEHKIYYKLNKTRNDTIMVEVAVPGQRWEIEYNTYGKSHEQKCKIEIEKFVSNGILYNESELETLFHDFSD